MISTISQFIRLSRPYNVLLPIVAILAGYTISAANDVPRLLLIVVLFTILHGVVTIWNDFEDEVSDALNDIHRLQSVRNAGNYQRYTRWMKSLVAISLLGGLFVGWQCAALLTGYVIIGWLYNARPARLSKRPLSSMACMLLAYGLAPFALGASLGTWWWQVVVLCLAWSCGRLSLSLLKDYKDAPGDAKAVKKTFLLVYGHRTVAWVSVALLVLAVTGILLVCANRQLTPALAVVAIPALWLVSKRLELFSRHQYAGLHDVFRNGLRYQLAFDTLVVLWLHTR